MKREKKEKEQTANDVAEMRDVVDVGQGAGDEDVALALNRKLWGFKIVASHLEAQRFRG